MDKLLTTASLQGFPQDKLMKLTFPTLFTIVLFASSLLAQNPEITISKETTFVTEPTTEDGFVDLISAINAQLSKGVTTETNAAAIIFPLLGPKPDGSFLAKRFYEELGVPAPPEVGDYFISLPDYLAEIGIDNQDPKFNQLLDQQGDAMEKPWRREEYPEIAGWLDANEIPLKQMIRGVQRPEYYCPINSDAEKGSTGQTLIATLLPHIQSIREVSRALSCRALLFTGGGKTAEAWRDLLASFRLGRHIAKGPFLIDALVGFAIEAISNRSMLVFLEHAKPKAKLAAGYLKDLSTLPERQSLAETTDLSERLVFIDIVAMLAYDKADNLLDIDDGLAGLYSMIKKSGLKIDWNLVLTNSNQWYDRFVETMENESYSAQQQAFTKFDKELSELHQKFQRPQLLKSFAFALLDVKTRSKYLSDILISLLVPAAKQASIAEHRGKQRFDNLRVAIALAGYRTENSSYPEQLKQLVPEYLETLPGDLFGEQALTYRKTKDGFLLYSVGSNQIDDGGKSFDEEKDDLVVRVPAPLKLN